MGMVMDIKNLQDEFPQDALDWRVQRSWMKDGKPWAVIVPYIDSRVIMNRLDDVCGPAGWQNTYNPDFAGGILCGIGIKIDNEWVWKYDGAEIAPEDDSPNPEKSKNRIDPIKSSFTNAFKRAAVQWGIGRYIYKIPSSFAVFGEKGKNTAKIKDTLYRWDAPVLPTQKPQNNSTTNKTPGDYVELRDSIWGMCLEIAYGERDAAAQILRDVAGIRGIEALIPKNAGDVYARMKRRYDMEMAGR